MSEQEFKPGDVVMLKMSGPHMTVEGVSATIVRCMWFDAHRRLRRDAFDDFVLKHVVSFP